MTDASPSARDRAAEIQAAAQDPLAVSHAVRNLREHVDGADTLVGRWSIGVALAELDRLGAIEQAAAATCDSESRVAAGPATPNSELTVAAPADVAGLLRAAAAGRREYADGTGDAAHLAEMRDTLLAQAATLDSAAQIADGDYRPLYGWLPSWRWTPEMGRLVNASGGDSISAVDVAALVVPVAAAPDDELEHAEEWCVFSGDLPEDGIVLVTDELADAEEMTQLVADPGIAARTVTTGPWVVKTRCGGCGSVVLDVTELCCDARRAEIEAGEAVLADLAAGSTHTEETPDA